MGFPYRFVVEWSEEDEAFVARVPALPNCAAHGDTADEAIREVQEAAQGMLAVLGAAAPPSDAVSSYSGKLQLRMPPSLHARLARLASAEGVSLNQLMVSRLSSL